MSTEADTPLTLQARPYEELVELAKETADEPDHMLGGRKVLYLTEALGLMLACYVSGQKGPR